MGICHSKKKLQIETSKVQDLNELSIPTSSNISSNQTNNLNLFVNQPAPELIDRIEILCQDKLQCIKETIAETPGFEEASDELIMAVTNHRSSPILQRFERLKSINSAKKELGDRTSERLTKFFN